MPNDDRNREQGGRQDREPGQEGDVQSDPRRTREQNDEERENSRPTREDVRQDDTPKAG